MKFSMLTYNSLKIAALFISSFCIVKMEAQQSGIIPFNYEAQFIYNPAVTSNKNMSDISAYYHQNFSGISNPPVSALIAGQMNFTDQNSAVGFALFQDEASLLRQTQLSGSFAYKMKAVFTDADFLALGIGANISNFGFRGGLAIVNDLEDPTLSENISSMSFNVSSGFLYSSSREFNRRRAPMIFQVGAGMSRIRNTINLSTNQRFQEDYLFHSLINLFIKTSQSSQLISYLEWRMVPNSFMIAIIGSRIELLNSFYGGLSYNTTKNIGIELGYQFKSFGSGQTKLVVVFGMPLGTLNQSINSGYGLKIMHGFGESVRNPRI